MQQVNLSPVIVVHFYSAVSGQKKASTAKNGKKASKAELSSDERLVYSAF